MLDHDREPAALEVERELVGLAIAVGGEPALEDRGVERALDSGFERAVEVAECQRAIVGTAEWIERRVERHRAGGERAGLVTAQDVDAAEVLDRREVLDDHLLARHPHGPLRERDGGDHRQELGRQTDRKRDREQDGLERVATEGDVDHEDEQHQEDHRLEDQHPELAHPAIELGLVGARGESRDDVTECRRVADREHDRSRGAADHRRAEEQQLRCVGAGRRDRAGTRGLLGGQRLARQRGLLDMEICRLDQPDVGRYEVARRQPHDITDDELASSQLDPFAIAPDRRRRGDLRLELLDRALGAKRLPEVDGGTQRDDATDDRRIHDLAEERRGHARDEQDHHEWIERRPDHPDQLRARAGAGELVRAALRESPPTLVGGEAVRGGSKPGE